MINIIKLKNKEMELQDILDYIEEQKNKDIIEEKNEFIKNENNEVIGTQYITKSIGGVINSYEIRKANNSLNLTHKYINPNQTIPEMDDIY